ncbi:MAG: (2E,6E)-farnesyl diphosphate synthase [Sedimenticola selenatireducens]|uniref:(2E,6E)-farnesyl diphosphate synthase n=1 Tax=Sedimenticola selenatireducens TaxID=191960 RepID=A0A558DWQ7_9GAMM|nr:farnesyl diphosphate synthase [Sedimenticola selenatireducens]TVO75575.1 (2E,6E)-farnesyl diphosphate synthase [Sedimenticola selenatireducens]TVT65481.1 MAG: (2E,6E)-farnesyl diphosphate synthase [Sedimenticola selenatireducens]
MESALKQYLQHCQNRVNDALEQQLPASTIQPQRLHQAMRYATLNGGKRVRPMLVYAAGAALGIASEQLDGPACAVELIHAYSLIHDDLPAMDDDDLRRGRPTCHKAFDEATAILAGDALQTLAFKVLCKDEPYPFSPEVRLNMIEALAHASGSRGMAGGQALDLAAVGQQIELAQLENMHIHKTGALIHASVKLGCLAAESATQRQIHHLEHYANCIGLAFQVQDDILDVESDTATLGKTQGKDEANGKPTYPSLIGMKAAKEMAQNLRQDALNSLAELDVRADPLRWLADYIVDRKA